MRVYNCMGEVQDNYYNLIQEMISKFKEELGVEAKVISKESQGFIKFSLVAIFKGEIDEEIKKKVSLITLASASNTMWI